MQRILRRFIGSLLIDDRSLIMFPKQQKLHLILRPHRINLKVNHELIYFLNLLPQMYQVLQSQRPRHLVGSSSLHVNAPPGAAPPHTAHSHPFLLRMSVHTSCLLKHMCTKRNRQSKSEILFHIQCGSTKSIEKKKDFLNISGPPT